MPDVCIEVKRGWIGTRKAAVLDAVHAAMVQAIRIPEHDRVLRLVEHEPEDFAIPPGRSAMFTRIEIMLFAGRTLAAKHQLYQAIVRNLGTLGVPALDIKIVLVEVPAENWGIRGGQPASEVELGFEIKV